MPVMKTLTINGRTYTVTPVVPTDSVTLLASAWEGENHKYSQVVELSGVTPHTKVDLQPTSEQLVEFHHKVLGFVAENDGGVVMVYSIGDKPANDHTIQVTMTEVDATGKIRGNTVGTTMPQSDWSQTDPTKADFIKNKPDSLGSTNGSGQNPPYIASDTPPEDTSALWIDTSDDSGDGSGGGVPGEAPTVTVTETAEGVIVTATDANGTTSGMVRHGRDGTPGADGKTPVKGEDYFTPDEVQEIAERAAGMVEVPESPEGGGGGGEYVEWEEILNHNNIVIEEAVAEIVYDLPRRYREYWFQCKIDNNLELESYSNNYKYGVYFDVDGFRANPYDMFNTTGATTWWNCILFNNIPYSLFSQGGNNENNLAATKASWLVKFAETTGKIRISFGNQAYSGNLARLLVKGRYPIE